MRLIYNSVDFSINESIKNWVQINHPTARGHMFVRLWLWPWCQSLPTIYLPQFAISIQSVTVNAPRTNCATSAKRNSNSIRFLVTLNKSFSFVATAQYSSCAFLERINIQLDLHADQIEHCWLCLCVYWIEVNRKKNYQIQGCSVNFLPTYVYYTYLVLAKLIIIEGII